MKRKNEGTILLPVSKRYHSPSRIKKIISMNEGKSFDLIHFSGADPNEPDCFTTEEIKEIAAEMPEIDKCYWCDVRGLVERFKDPVDPHVLLASFQLRCIILNLALAFNIKTMGYDEIIYYSMYMDYRLTEIPASTILKDPGFYCLISEMESTAPADLAAKRFFLSRALSFSDHKPEYGYAMKEKDIKKLCRRIIRSRILKTLKPEEIDFKKSDNP